MDIIMQIVSKYCKNELDTFGECVQNNPGDWHVKCNQYKARLTECSSSHPGVQNVKTKCSEEFAAYDVCLKENPDKVDNCVPTLLKFLECADNAAINLEKTLKSQQGEM
ncbi:coiled-coil-helix-coiled-coil-helix domain-containing protein 5-like [Glandiceps talaboti]